MAPFIVSIADAHRVNRSHFKDIFPEANPAVPLVPQVLAHEPRLFVSTANAIADFGYGEVNWNLGCPYPMVTRKKRGSGMLPYPDLIDRFLDEACRGAKVPISVKLRLGLKDAAEIDAVVPVLNRYPLKGVTLHARVGAQMYEGPVDLDAFERAARAIAHPLCYNGDLKDEASFIAFSQRFTMVNEWMIGRWALRDPFLPARLKGLPIPPDPLAAIGAFHDRLYRAYAEWLHGPRHLLDKMRELWGYLAHAVPGGHEVRKRVVKAASPAEYADIAARAFGRLTQGA
jgi:tRNA-dihydrouridine synthase